LLKGIAPLLGDLVGGIGTHRHETPLAQRAEHRGETGRPV
jgi:hypothetical protein